MKYTSTHKSYYYKGVEIPSATTILKILNKPALVKWANYLGFKKQNVDMVLNEKSELGTYIHSMIEAIIAGELIVFAPTEKFTKETVYSYLNGFFTWFNRNKIEPIFQEHELTCERYGGTVDFYGMVNDKHTIVDFKTSKQIRISMFIQLALYCILLEYNGYKVEQVGIVLANNKCEDTKFITREELEPYVKFADKLIDIYHMYYDLNSVDGWSEFII